MDSLNEQFSLIYDQYIEKIYRFVYLKVSSQEIAQDLTSKVFMNGWEACQRGTKINNPGAFLYQIARNSVVDYYREKEKRKTVSIGHIPEILDHKTDIYEKAVLGAQVEAVKLAIADIKQDYQDVIIWHYLEDMPAEQIAMIMDKPAGTVRVM